MNKDIGFDMQLRSTSNQEIEKLFVYLAKEKIQSCRYFNQPEQQIESMLWLLPEITLRYYTLNNDHFDSIENKNEKSTDYHEVKESLQKKVSLFISQYDINKKQRDLRLEKLNKKPDNLLFRHWHINDAETYFRYLSDPTLWEYLPDSYPNNFDIETARDIIEHANQPDLNHYIQAVDFAGHIVGQFRLIFDEDKASADAEVSYWVARKYQGQGITKKVFPYFIGHAFSKFPHLEKISGIVATPNKASAKILLHAGFHKESLLNQVNYTHQGSHPALKYSVYRNQYIPSSSIKIPVH